MTNQSDKSIRLWSMRDTLIRIHENLLRIDECVYSEYGRLTILEFSVLASEDHRFFRHKGVDWVSVVREMSRFLTGRRMRGASTIEMQLVRTITSRYEKTFRRKVREVVISSVIQLRYSKVDILRTYLRVAYFGNGLRGAEEASQRVFRCSASGLNLEQSAIIASMLIYPRPRLPTKAWENRVSKRAGKILVLYAAYKEKFDKLDI